MTAIGSGCFAYAPLNGANPLPAQGSSVRAHLSEPGAFSLSDVTANNVIRVDGEVVQWDPDQLVLSAWWMRSRSGLEHKGVGETVLIPRSDIATLEHKQIAPGRTVAFVAAVVGFVLLIGSQFGGGGADEGPGPPPPPQQ
jgi:hypothetical protein